MVNEVKVMVLDGENKTALSITRSLGKKGFRVIVGSSSSTCMAGKSRYCYKTVKYPSVRENRGRFVDFMLNFLAREKVDVLLSATDNTLVPIMENRDDFEKHAALPLPSYDSFMKAYDKGLTMEIAKRLGVPIPKTYIPADKGELLRISRDIGYPAVLKPRISKYWSGGKYRSGIRRYVSTPEELVSNYEEMDRLIPNPIIQEFVNGDGAGIFLLFDGEKTVLRSAHKRIKEVPLDGGPSVLCRSMEPDPKLLAYSESLLREIDWFGVAMVEFRKNPETGEAWLMEINGRFWGSLELAVSSGIDYPYHLVMLTLGRDVDEDIEYKIGHRCRDIRGEFEHLYLYIFKNPGGRPSFKDAAGNIIDTMKPFKRDTSNFIFSWKDPVPFLYSSSRYLRNKFREKIGR